MKLGHDAPATLEQTGGTLTAETIDVGLGGTGDYIWTGGTLAADVININPSGNMAVETSWTYDGTLNLKGGSLSVTTLVMESASEAAALNITNANSEVLVNDTLRFGANSALTCVAGGEIHLVSAGFENESTDVDALSGLENLKVVFEGGGYDCASFEVAGENKGAESAGWDDNFLLGTLQIGEGGRITWLRLVDLFDNQPAWEGHEALYVENLILSWGSHLDLNGLDLYYRTFTNLGGTIALNGGVFSSALPGDLDGDGTVGSGDLDIVRAEWGHEVPAGVSSRGDANGDGFVNSADLDIVRSGWGTGIAAVPEPSAAMLFGVGILGCLGWRRKRRDASRPLRPM